MAVSRLLIVKFLELTLTCICIGIHYHSFECLNIHRSMLTTGTYVGFIIIMIGMAAGHVLQTPVNRRIDIFFSLIGCCLFITSGVLIIETYQHAFKGDYKDKQLAKASMSIINGVVFFADAILTARGE